MMRQLAHWDPFREMAPIFGPEVSGFYPAFDVKENKHGFFFTADLPGFKPQDLYVTMEGLRLWVRGKREFDRDEKLDTYYVTERQFGDFLRTFTLPQGVDPATVRADLQDGVLTIAVGRTLESEPRQIPIQAAAIKPKS
jgi:HSP20 family protein